MVDDDFEAAEEFTVESKKSKAHGGVDGGCVYPHRS
jgi:hypothetical protein